MKKMKKYVNMIALIVVICMVFALPVSAESVIMRGYTDPSAKGVSILITKTPVEVENITSEDIVWVDQQSINETEALQFPCRCLLRRGIRFAPMP